MVIFVLLLEQGISGVRLVPTNPNTLGAIWAGGFIGAAVGMLPRLIAPRTSIPNSRG